MVINELITLDEQNPTKQLFLTYMLERKKINPTKND